MYGKDYSVMHGLREKVVKKAVLHKNSNILEVGFGDGYMTLELSADSRINSVTALDYCIDWAIDAKKNTGSKKITFVCNDFFSFRPGKKFDAVFFFISLSDICGGKPLLKKALETVRLLLKDNGLLVVSDNFIHSNLDKKDLLGAEINKELGYSVFQIDEFRKFLHETDFAIEDLFVGPKGREIKREELMGFVEKELSFFERETGKKKDVEKIVSELCSRNWKSFRVDSRMLTVYARKQKELK